MPMHFRLADALSQAHLMACTQKKLDIAGIILNALEVESKTYGASQAQKRDGASLLALAQSRQKQLENELAS